MKSKRFKHKQIMALGIVVTTISSSIGTYAEESAAGNVSEVVNEKQEAKAEEAKEKAGVSELQEVENVNVTEVTPETEVIPGPETTNVVPEPVSINAEPEMKAVMSSSVPEPIANTELEDAKEELLATITNVETSILYPTSEITTAFANLRIQVNEMTDVSQKDGFFDEIAKLNDLAERTIYECEITYDVNYPYEYEKDSDLENIGYIDDNNITCRIVDICGTENYLFVGFNSIEYSNELNVIQCEVYPMGADFTNANDFIQTISVPVKKVESKIELPIEVTNAINDAILTIQNMVSAMTGDMDAELKSKVIALQDEYIVRIKACTTVEEVSNVSSEAQTTIGNFILNGGVDESQIQKWRNETYAELDKISAKVLDLTNEANRNDFIARIQELEVAIGKSIDKTEMDSFVTEASTLYDTLMKKEADEKKALSDAKTALLNELKEIDVTKYDEIDRNEINKLIKNAKTNLNNAIDLDGVTLVRDTFFEAFSKFETTEDKANKELSNVKKKAIEILDTLDYSMLTAENQTKVVDKISLAKINIQSASTILDVNTTVETVKDFINQLKSQEETAKALAKAKEEAIARVNKVDTTLYDTEDKKILDTLKTTTLTEIQDTKVISEINQIVSSFEGIVKTYKTSAEKEIERLETTRTNAFRTINAITYDDLLKDNQEKVTIYLNTAKDSVTNAKTIAEIDTIVNDVTNYMVEIRNQDAQEKVLIEEKNAAVKELKKVDLSIYDKSDKEVLETLRTEAIAGINKASTKAEIQKLVESFKEKAGTFETSAEKEAKRLAKAKADAIDSVESFDISMMAEKNQTKANTVKEAAAKELTDAKTVEDVESLLGAALKNLENLKAEDMAEKTLAEAKASAVEQINAINKMDYDEEDREAVIALKEKYLEAVKKAETTISVTDSFQQFQKELDKIFTTEKKAQIALEKCKQDALEIIGSINLTGLSGKYQYIMANYIQETKTKIENAATIEDVKNILNTTEAYFMDIQKQDLDEKFKDAKSDLENIYVGSFDKLDIGKIDLSTIKDGAADGLKSYLLIAQYKIDKILENVRLQIQKLIESETKSIALRNGNRVVVLSEEGTDTILGIDISGLSDENKLEAIEIFNRAAKEIDKIIKDADSYIKSVTKDSSMTDKEENPETKQEESIGALPAADGGQSFVTTEKMPKAAPKTSDDTDAAVPFLKGVGALAIIAALLKRKKH